jgi:hypothetical protein
MEARQATSWFGANTSDLNTQAQYLLEKSHAEALRKHRQNLGRRRQNLYQMVELARETVPTLLDFVAGRHDGAVQIQTVWRGKYSRGLLRLKRTYHLAAIAIILCWKCRVARKSVHAARCWKAATKITGCYRRHRFKLFVTALIRETKKKRGIELLQRFVRREHARRMVRELLAQREEAAEGWEELQRDWVELVAQALVLRRRGHKGGHGRKTSAGNGERRKSGGRTGSTEADSDGDGESEEDGFDEELNIAFKSDSRPNSPSVDGQGAPLSRAGSPTRAISPGSPTAIAAETLAASFKAMSTNSSGVARSGGAGPSRAKSRRQSAMQRLEGKPLHRLLSHEALRVRALQYVSRAAPLHVNSYRVDTASLPGLLQATGVTSQVHASYGKLVVLMSVYEVKDGSLDAVVTFLPASKHTVGLLHITKRMWKFLAFGEVAHHTHHELEQLAVKLCIALTAAIDDIRTELIEPLEEDLKPVGSAGKAATEEWNRKLRRRSSANTQMMRLAVERRYVDKSGPS